MVITWQGQFFFDIKTKGAQNSDVEIIINPSPKAIKKQSISDETKIFLFSNENNVLANEKTIGKGMFLIKEPGEYEKRGVFIGGIPTSEGVIAVFTVKSEDLKICYISDSLQKELTSEQVEKIGEVDVLIVPIEGGENVNQKTASALIFQLEPKIAIPMGYANGKEGSYVKSLSNFLKVMGAENIQPQKKLKLNSKNFAREGTEIVILAP